MAAVNLKSKSARQALPVRRDPYFVALRTGVYVGFRRLAEGDGTWVARRLVPGSKTYQFKALGALPDYEQAVEQVNAWAGAVDMGVSHKTATVSQACETYVQHLKTAKSKASATDAEGRFKRLVYDTSLGNTPLDKVRTVNVRRWLHDQLDDSGDEDDVRRSKDSANRNLNALKAALNLALRDRLVSTDAGWKTVTPFTKAGKRRTADLSVKDKAELLKQCDGQLRGLVQALLLTAVRPGELASANVGDFDRDRGTLRLTGKTGTRTVTLSTAAVTLFTSMTKDKLPTAPLLTDDLGNRWNKDAWKKPFREACKAAKLPDSTVMYTLRHAAISDMIAGGVDSFVVARLAGTSTTMIDKHYGHLRIEQTRAKLDAVQAVG
jgi:integrase